DLTNVESSDPAVRRRLVDEVKDACTRVGFFYVKNHGIPETVFERTLDAMRLFFDLLLDLKLEIENNNSPNFKGYSAILSGNNDPNGAGDLQEGFEFGYEVVDGPSRKEPQDDVMSAPNVWPAALPEFRTAALDYYHHALRLGGQIFPLFALALDLPHDFFADKVRVASGTSSRDGRVRISFALDTRKQLTRTTDDYFTSTVHRAINGSGIERYSI
ncbi:hypothetical protein C8F01DRAFT_1002680, partial [Mycena amicta]